MNRGENLMKKRPGYISPKKRGRVNFEFGNLNEKILCVRKIKSHIYIYIYIYIYI